MPPNEIGNEQSNSDTYHGMSAVRGKIADDWKFGSRLTGASSP